MPPAPSRIEGVSLTLAGGQGEDEEVVDEVGHINIHLPMAIQLGTMENFKASADITVSPQRFLTWII